MPRRGHVKMFCYVPPEFKAKLRDESKARKITLGRLIQEAFEARVRMVRR